MITSADARLEAVAGEMAAQRLGSALVVDGADVADGVHGHRRASRPGGHA
jgi:hypothetical protein